MELRRTLQPTQRMKGATIMFIPRETHFPDPADIRLAEEEHRIGYPKPPYVIDDDDDWSLLCDPDE